MNITSEIHFETNIRELHEALICIIIAIVIEIIGNGLLILVIVYERFTMDPQKRTVINQLVSIACLIFIIHNIIGVPIMTYILLVNDGGKHSFFRVYFLLWNNFLLWRTFLFIGESVPKQISDWHQRLYLDWNYFFSMLLYQ